MGEPLFCDCHEGGDRRAAKLAERHGRYLIIRDRQFGEQHSLVIDIVSEYNRFRDTERQRSASTGSPKSDMTSER